jgi:hypothetical protein
MEEAKKMLKRKWDEDDLIGRENEAILKTLKKQIAALKRENAFLLMEEGISKHVKSTGDKFEQLEKKMDAWLEQHEKKMDAKLDQLEKKMDARLGQHEKKMDAWLERIEQALKQRA